MVQCSLHTKSESSSQAVFKLKSELYVNSVHILIFMFMWPEISEVITKTSVSKILFYFQIFVIIDLLWYSHCSTGLSVFFLPSCCEVLSCIPLLSKQQHFMHSECGVYLIVGNGHILKWIHDINWIFLN